MDKASFPPIHTQPIHPGKIHSSKQNQLQSNSFSLHLQQALSQKESLTLSKHAKERLRQRGIQISDTRWAQIEAKVKEAKKMGVKESLVLLEEAALIVSARNNTVITAMDRQEAKTQIFTNINGTIILE